MLGGHQDRKASQSLPSAIRATSAQMTNRVRIGGGGRIGVLRTALANGSPAASTGYPQRLFVARNARGARTQIIPPLHITTSIISKYGLNRGAGRDQARSDSQSLLRSSFSNGAPRNPTESAASQPIGPGHPRDKVSSFMTTPEPSPCARSAGRRRHFFSGGAGASLAYPLAPDAASSPRRSLFVAE